MLYTLLHLLYIPVCIFLILVVLLQTGKRADLQGAFGGGGSQTAFGARGAATLLSKLTTVMAVLFMITALSLAIMTTRRAGPSGSVLDELPAEDAPSAPAFPGDAGGTVPDLPPLTEEPADDEPAIAEPGEDTSGSEGSTGVTGDDSQP